MHNEMISIIIPVYNVEKYLTECLNSVVEQTYQNIEVLLIDDGSKDSSGKICDEFKKQYNFIKVFHIENSGVSHARNLGIRKAIGEWITFVDSDDIIDKNYCKYLINAVDSNIDFVIGRTLSFINNDVNTLLDDGYNACHEETIHTCNEKKELFKSIFIDNKKLIKYPHVSTCSSKLIRKSLLIENNIFYDLNMFLYEDAFFNALIINFSNSIKIINEKIYFYRYNQNSSSNRFRNKIIEQYEYIYIKFLEFSKNYQLNLEMYMNYFKIKNLNTILTNYCNSNDSKCKFVKKICKDDIYKLALKEVDYFQLPKKRKMLFLLNKLHLHYLIYLMYKIK